MKLINPIKNKAHILPYQTLFNRTHTAFNLTRLAYSPDSKITLFRDLGEILKGGVTDMCLVSMGGQFTMPDMGNEDPPT